MVQTSSPPRAADKDKHEGRHVLEALSAATRRAQRTGQPNLRLAMSPGSDGGLLRDILAAYESEPDAIPIEVIVRHVGRLAMLRDGRVDVALLYRPASDLSGLDTEELLVERALAVLPREHRLAGHAEVRLADLRGEVLARWPGVPDDRWPGNATDFATGPVVRDPGQLMQLIALGRTITVEPPSVLGPLRPELVGIPVIDAPLSRVVLAWPRQSRSLALAAFVRATRHRAEP